MSLLTEASLLLTPNAYKEGKLYSIIPSNGNGDLTVTRATTATRVNAAGFVELVPYNLFQYSEQFNNAAWTTTDVSVTPNSTTAPNGTLTADTLIGNGVSGVPHRISPATVQGISVISGTTYTVSCYVKKNTNNFFQFYFLAGQFTANAFANFDVNNGVLGTVGPAATATITDVGNGWYRCSMTSTAISTATSGVSFSLITSATSTRNEPNALSTSVFLWGAQFVEGTSALNYQATETRLNIPRIDFSLGGCPNILLEPQRTNLALYSEDFADATWSKTRTTVTQNTTLSPDNTLGADTIEVTAPGQCHIGQSVTTTTTTLNVSIYCKYINQQFLQIYSSSSALAYANFDILNGVVGSNGTNASNVQITTAANGFYRLSVSLIVPAAAIVIRFAFVASSTSAYNATEGVAGRQFFAWGTSFESGTTSASYATSYIPTAGVSVTRNFDYVTRNNLVTNGIVSATQGTWFVEIRNNLVLARDNSTTVFTFGQDGNNGIRFRPTGTGRLAVEKVVGGAITVLVSPVSATQTMKVAFKWDGSLVKTFMNGVLQVPANETYPSTIVPQTVTSNFTNTNPGVPIYINQMAFFPTQLTDAQCIALTT